MSVRILRKYVPYLSSYLVLGVCPEYVKAPSRLLSDPHDWLSRHAHLQPSALTRRTPTPSRSLCFMRNYLMSHFGNWGIFFSGFIGVSRTVGEISISRGWLTQDCNGWRFNERKLASLYLSCLLSLAVYTTAVSPDFTLLPHVPVTQISHCALLQR